MKREPQHEEFIANSRRCRLREKLMSTDARRVKIITPLSRYVVHDQPLSLIINEGLQRRENSHVPSLANAPRPKPRLALPVFGVRAVNKASLILCDRLIE